MEASDYKAMYGQAALFDGESFDSTAVLVRYTYYGDADFDGGVSINDFNLLSTNFGKTTPAEAPLPSARKGVAPAKRLA